MALIPSPGSGTCPQVKRSSEKYQGDLSQAEGEGILPTPGETEGHRSPRLPEPRSADTPGMYSSLAPCPALFSSDAPTAPQGREDAPPISPPPSHRPAPQRTPARSPCVFPRPVWSMLPAAMKGLGLVLLAALLCSAPAHGLWCQDCTLTTNSSHCTPKQCQPSDTVCASVRITDPSSSRKDHSVNRMCASSCDFVKRHFFSDYLMGFINSGILKVDVDCCEKDLCNGVSGARGSPWALVGGLLLSLGPTLLRAGP
nr:PREDICTED: lymphocyte antigen 6H isoform X1 [Rhinolophus sinicus]